MITYDGVEYRNLVEQVAQNKEDIARHYAVDRVLADFGIKIIGQVDYASQLPAAATYVGEYGDAYAVGTSEPYDFYIWTRANDVNPSDFWFDVGKLAIAGPQGAPGEQGEPGAQGEPGVRGSRWTVYPYNRPTTDVQVGDTYLNENGTTQTYTSNLGWVYGVSLVGPAGPRGLPGPRGDGLKGEESLIQKALYDAVAAKGGDYQFNSAKGYNIVYNMSTSDIFGGTAFLPAKLYGVSPVCEIGDGEAYLFGDETSLKQLFIPEGFKEINFGAIVYCENFEVLYLPSTITKLSERAFDDSTPINRIYYNGTRSDWLAIDVEDYWTASESEPDIYFIDGDFSTLTTTGQLAF